MEAIQVKLEVRLTQLRLRVEKSKGVIESNQREPIEKHCHRLKSITNDMRLKVEEAKIEAKEDLDEINQWHLELDEKLSQADVEIKRLQTWTEVLKKEQKLNVKED